MGLTKICNDLRWMASGPTTGLAEIHLPDLQPGSSIMPGKVNPVLPEATLMVCAQVIGNDATVTTAGASGAFELNVMMPVIARSVLESIRILSTSSRLLAERCVDGITADADRMRRYAESSPSVVTPLNRYLGYEEAAKVAKQSLAEGRTIRETGARDGLRRPRRAHPRPARRGARRRGDDAPVTSPPTAPRSARPSSSPEPATGSGARRPASSLRRATTSCSSGAAPRSRARAAEQIRAESPGVPVGAPVCDFASLADVRGLARRLVTAYPRIDVLVNNAGTVFDKRTVTGDGHEATFQINHLSGFLLTELLLDRLRASAPARIVTTASASHYRGTLDFDDLGFDRGYQIMRAYARSKLANVLHTRELARRLEGTASPRPACPRSGRDESERCLYARPVLACEAGRDGLSREPGGARIAYLATDPAVEGVSGAYYEKDRSRSPRAGPGRCPRRPAGRGQPGAAL